MQPARLDRPSASKLTASTKDNLVEKAAGSSPTSVQAAAYIHDMASTLRNLAAQHNLTTLALILEMAAVEAGTLRPPQA